VGNNEDIVSTEDSNDLQAGGDDLDTLLTIKDILTNLDQGAAQFAAEVQVRPNYVYNLMGKLCNSLHLLQEHNNLLH
jgi:hypothetical protein